MGRKCYVNLNAKLDRQPGLLNKQPKADNSQGSFRSTTLRWFVRLDLGIVGKNFGLLDNLRLRPVVSAANRFEKLAQSKKQHPYPGNPEEVSGELQRIASGALSYVGLFSSSIMGWSIARHVTTIR